MKEIKNICILLIVGLPLLGFSQEKEKTEIKKFDISLELEENWKIKNKTFSRVIFVENKVLKSTFKIELVDYKKTLDKISNTETFKDIGVDVVKLSSVQKSINGTKVHASFSRSESKLLDNSEIFTIEKTINDKAYLIEATFPKGCSQCKEEFQSMVSSMEEIETGN
jgi:hypothetical protein